MPAHPAAAEIRALSRRRFLKTGLLVAAGGVAVLGGTFAWLARSPKDAQPKPAGIHALSDREYHLFAAICAAALPGEDNTENLLPWMQVPVLAHIDELIADVPAHARGDVGKALQLFDYAPVLAHGKRFTDLSVADARAMLVAWNQGGEIKRAVSNLVRKLAYIGYWRESATWAPIDYEGPVMVKWGLQRLGNAPLPALYAKSSVNGST